MANIEKMTAETKKWAIVFIGPPGSGKGTQADMVADKFGLEHLESSKIIEDKFKKSGSDNSTMAHEKETWQAGELTDPNLVRTWIGEEIKKIHKSGKGIVLSASPRTTFEAETEMPLLDKLYGRENIRVFHIKLSKEESIHRNSRRRICKENRHPVADTPEFENLTVCPRCGSELMTRGELDKPETISVRYEVYLKRTQPVLDMLSKAGYKINVIDGEQAIEKVYGEIINHLEN